MLVSNNYLKFTGFFGQNTKKTEFKPVFKGLIKDSFEKTNGHISFGDSNDPSLSECIKMLKDFSGSCVASDNRKYACEVLGKLGLPGAVRPLIELLERVDAPGSSSAAARALGQIGDPRAVQPLIDSLDPKDDSRTRQRDIIVALGQIGDSRAVQPLIDLIKNNVFSKDKINYAIEALGEIKDPWAIPLLKDLLENSNFSDAAAKALKKIKPSSNLSASQTVETLPKKESTEVIQKDTISSRSNDGFENVPIPGSSSTMRLKPLGDNRYLKQIGPDKYITVSINEQGLVSAVDTDKKDDATHLTQSSKQTLDPNLEKKISELIEALEDPHSDTRQNASKALILAGSSAVEPLIKALEDMANRDIHDRIMYILGEIGDERAIKPLKDYYLNETSYGDYYYKAAREAWEKIEAPQNVKTQLKKKYLDIIQKDNIDLKQLKDVISSPNVKVKELLDNYEHTPIHILAEMDTSDETTLEKVLELIGFCIKKDVDINAQDNLVNETALFGAYRKKNSIVAEFLLSKRADPNIQNVSGDTVLHYACFEGDKELVKLVLKYKPNLMIKNNQGKTGLDYAIEKGHTDIVNLING